MDDSTYRSPTGSVEKLFSRIAAEILESELQPGHHLGTENEICARYGVSPTTFRQAARLLEAADLAVTRPGNRGGLIVHGYSLDGAAKTVATYLEFKGADAGDVAPVSAQVLRLAVATSASHISLALSDDLRRKLAEIGVAESHYERGIRFIDLFQRIVNTAKNPLLSLVYRTATHFLSDITSFESASRQAFENSQAGAVDLLEAIIANDAPNIPSTLDRWLALNRGSPPPTRPATPPSTRQVVDLKGSPATAQPLSERLARQILHDIRVAKWPTGSHLGSEPELMARYSVSRATFRQAVHLLEQYFAVRTRRGPRGGLFVGSPDPDRVNNLTVAALVQSGVTWAHVSAFLPILVGLAVEEATQSDGHVTPDVSPALALALAGTDPSALSRAVAGAVAASCTSPFVSFIFQLLSMLQPHLGQVTPPSAYAHQLATQASKAFSVTDLPRARRALIELFTTFGV